MCNPGKVQEISLCLHSFRHEQKLKQHIRLGTVGMCLAVPSMSVWSASKPHGSMSSCKSCFGSSFHIIRPDLAGLR